MEDCRSSASIDDGSQKYKYSVRDLDIFLLGDFLAKKGDFASRQQELLAVLSRAFACATLERRDNFIDFADFVRSLGEPVDEHFCANLVVLVASTMGDLNRCHASSLVASCEPPCSKMVSIVEGLCRWLSGLETI